MFVREAREAADECETAIRELLMAIIGEPFDEKILARHHFREVESHFARLDAKNLRMPGEVMHFGGVEQRFGGHAPAQDAQAADFLASLDDDGLQFRSSRGAGRGVTGAATAQNANVVVERMRASCHAKGSQAKAPLSSGFTRGRKNWEQRAFVVAGKSCMLLVQRSTSRSYGILPGQGMRGKAAQSRHVGTKPRGICEVPAHSRQRLGV